MSATRSGVQRSPGVADSVQRPGFAISRPASQTNRATWRHNSGPNPVEQVLAALGNCLAVGYAANATAAGIEIRGMTIKVEGDLDLHTFLA